MKQEAILFVAFPVLMLLAALEGWLRHRRGQDIAMKESLASLGVALGHHASSLLFAAAGLGTLGWIGEHRLWSVPIHSAWAVALLFFAVEFAYYWHHRLSHQVRWLWASHAVHHSPEHLNLSAAYRLAWTGQLAAMAIIAAPLIWLGFPAKAVGATLALNLLYQFWAHTELIPSLGWFDRVFNSPSNHRVHHAVNADYLDRNYGGVLMVFDHLFGTYQAERAGDPCRYGLVHPISSHNPFVVALRTWKEMLSDVFRARNSREVLGYLFRSPDWRPHQGS